MTRDEQGRLRLIARFQPQVWVDDDAHEIDGAHDFDATRAVLDLKLDEIKTLSNCSLTADDVARISGALVMPDGTEHTGPFYVGVMRGLRKFLLAHGYTKDSLTQNQLDALREFYKDLPQPQQPYQYIIKVIREDLTDIPPARSFVLVRKIVMTETKAKELKKKAKELFRRLGDGNDEFHSIAITKVDDVDTMLPSEFDSWLDEFEKENQ